MTGGATRLQVKVVACGRLLTQIAVAQRFHSVQVTPGGVILLARSVSLLTNNQPKKKNNNKKRPIQLVEPSYLGL